MWNYGHFLSERSKNCFGDVVGVKSVHVTQNADLQSLGRDGVTNKHINPNYNYIKK